MIEPGGYLVILVRRQARRRRGGGHLHRLEALGQEGRRVPPHRARRQGRRWHRLRHDLADGKSWGRLPDGTGSFIPTTPTPAVPNI